MVLKKRNANLSVVSGGGIQKKKAEAVDHWAFLEEIEAPMWVDFTLEDEFLYKDIDDAWFRTVHPFHECPSHHLISSSSLSSEGKMKSPELLQLSPKLPDSVSKSRGNHYRSRKWEAVGHVALTSKQHPIRILDGKSSSDVVHSNLTSAITLKSSSIKPTTSSGNPKSSSNPKASLTSECKPTSTITSKSPSIRPKASFGDLESTSNSNARNTGDNNQQPLIPGSANHMVGYTSRLLSSMRISLTKSCVTRHASRVEVKEGGLPKQRKSSTTSKSSVGSSFNPGYNLESSNPPVNEEGTPESRKDTNVVRPSSNKVSYVLMTSFNTNVVRPSNISLTKSCVRRHASRVEVKEGALPKQRKSSTTSKSSVGSSFNPGYNLESGNLPVNDEGTPESRNDTNVVRPSNNKVSYVWKTSKGHIPDRGSNSNLKWGGKASEPIFKEAKAKVLRSSKPRKPLWSHNAVDLPKEKVTTKSNLVTASSKFSRVVGVGKENAATYVGRNQKAPKQEIQVKDGDRLTDVKTKARGRAQGKEPTNAASRMHFR